jgi:hypothetical protein
MQQLERIFGTLDNYSHTGKAALPETGINVKRTRKE